MKFETLALLSMFVFCSMLPAADIPSLASPDKKIELSAKANDGKLFYSVKFNEKAIIADLRLGVSLKGGAFDGKLVVENTKLSSHDLTWKPVWGDFNEYRDHYPVAWYAAGTNSVKGATALQDLAADEATGKKATRCGTPFTVQVAEDCFVSLHEAAVIHSSDARIQVDKDGRTLTYNSRSSQATHCVSAWRTVTIASRPGGLVESSLILNLNDPCELADTSWIKPGVSLWDWRVHGAKADDGFVYGINTDSYIRYIDFAHGTGLRYVLVDAEWYGPERSADSDPITCIDGADMAKICEYANSKGVGMWVYLNDVALKKYDLDRTFSTYQKWGVVGIKHGFLNGGSQAKNEFSHEVVRKCAKYHIMYNLHEPNKPTGVRRTLPNYMTREYTNGMLDGPGRPASTPTQLCTFPVVHNLAGPVDRSCGMFDLDASITRKKVHRHLPTTVASQTAQCLIFPTGVLTIPDHPDAYKRKSDLFEFIRMLPMTWDETRVPEMEIGNFVTIARRSGQQWFVGSLANEAGRKLELKLDFLEPGITYDVTLYEDGADADYQTTGSASRREVLKKGPDFVPSKTKRELYQVRTQTVQKGDTVSAVIVPGGGHTMWICPQVQLKIEGTLLSDANADGVISNLDIASFALALFQPALYEVSLPDVAPDLILDMNQDEAFNNLDIAAFAAALGF